MRHTLPTVKSKMQQISKKNITKIYTVFQTFILTKLPLSFSPVIEYHITCTISCAEMMLKKQYLVVFEGEHILHRQ